MKPSSENLQVNKATEVYFFGLLFMSKERAGQG